MVPGYALHLQDDSAESDDEEKRMNRRENIRKHLGKRNLFNIGRDYMDDRA